MEGVEHPPPDSLPGPAVEPPPDAVPLAEAVREVTPRGPRLGDPENRVDEQAVVLGDLPVLPGAAGQEILDPPPVVVRDRVAGVHGGSSLVSCRDPS